MDDDFERRMELRRQRREQMRMEAESMSYGTVADDEEEAARERRRRAREERMKNKDLEDSTCPATDLINNNSVTETESSPSDAVSSTGGGGEEEAALLDRLAKREERRQKRMKEAQDRQKEFDPTATNGTDTGPQEDRSSEEKEEQATAPETNSWRTEDEQKEEEEETAEEKSPKEGEPALEPAPEPEKEVVEEKKGEEEKQVVEEKPKKLGLREKQQNGGLHEEGATPQKKPERSVGFSRSSMRSPEAEDRERQEAERKLEDLKRRRENADSEEFEKLKQKQQEAEADLEMLKKKREERRKIIEEEEKQKKQEMADKKAKEQEERKKMKEEIERRRAEAAEKKKQMQEEGSVDGKPAFTCVTPKGSSKIGERAEFLNKSAQKSSIKTSHTPIVSKIGNRLEQYTTAVQGNKEPKSPRSPVGDLPVGGARNMKNMWEKGNVLGASESPTSTNKDAAGIKVGVAGRVNDWLAKPPAEAGKAAAGASPADLKLVDVTNERGLWETKKSDTPAKVTVGSKNKSVTNAGMGH